MNETKDVIIKIVSSQDNGEFKESGELTVVGKMRHEKNQSIIEYTEQSEEMGNEDMILTVKDGKEVRIIRRGAFSSEMTVEQNVRHHTFYYTPYGELSMGIYGNQVDWFRNGKKSVLKMKYTLSLSHSYTTENTMNIYIEEK